MKVNGLWRIKESQEKYKNHWIRVREDKVIQPDGKDGIYGIVEMLDGVCILPIDDDGYIYLIDQFRYTMEKNTIEVAGGSINNSEEILDAAKRELKEETGIMADEWIALGVINQLTTAVKSFSSIYLARKLRFFEARPESTEQIKVLKVKFDDAIKMIMEDKITHSPTCALMLKASEYLKKQI